MRASGKLAPVVLALAGLLAGCQKPAANDGAANQAVAQAGAGDPVARGRYLTTVMDCGGCHDTGAFADKRAPEGHLAGSDIGFELPGMGVFYPPNLTPNPDTGIGKWSEADIVKALRTGERPDGRILAPIMPWNNYAKLTDEDARAIVAYLRSLPPSPHRSPGPAQAATAKSPYLTVKAP
jgi:mono/diheme cytochrome c family protein